MNSKPYWFLFSLIIIISTALRLLPLRNNNFYFTMDQANDAVHAREILHGRLQLLGPPTNVPGLYAGPLWYYFVSLGYLFSNGHPAGPLLLIILLSILNTFIIMLAVKKYVSPQASIFIGSVLNISWWYFEPSRYAFNPFPLVALAFIFALFTTATLGGNTKKYIFAAIPLGLGFNSEVAGSLALTITYTLIGIFMVATHKLSLKTLSTGFLLLILFFTPHLVSELKSNFSHTRTLLNEVDNPTGVFTSNQGNSVSLYYLEIISNAILPQIPKLGIFIFVLVITAFFARTLSHSHNKFILNFTISCLLITVVSWLFFISNSGWRDWHTLYLTPLILISTLLVLYQIPHPVSIFLITIIVLSQLSIFVNRYQHNFSVSDDPSILANELKAINWVYQKAQTQGFYVYNYLPSVYDYPYQYLFWWHGLKTYGYLPCEYSSFPASPKLFLPHANLYTQPTKPCDKLRFLIIEPDKEQSRQDIWYEATTKNTQLLETTYIGKIRVEKRQLP